MRRVAYALLLIVGIALIVMPLSVPRFKSDAPYSVLNTGPDGTSRFGALLYHSGKVVPVLFPYSSFSEGNATLVMIEPDVSLGAGELEVLRSFIEKGGTLLLATDSDVGNSILRELSLKQRVSREKALTITFLNGLPVTREVSGSLARGVPFVALREPSVILGAQNPILFTSNATMFRGSYGRFPLADEVPHGKGRIIIISDPGIFTNALFDENEPFLRNLIAGLPKTFYIDEAHHRDLNPYSSGTVVIQRAVNRKLVFYYVLFVALVVFFVESGLALRFLAWSLGLVFSILEKLFGSEEESLEDILRRLEARGYDGDKLKRLIEEIETGSKLGGAHGR
ncbi:DUF4350 domain-containing protein [Thermococcus sp. 9N3]|uniref:DUF4350 domain-containing protein n=1 Tax=Thermococcus sp. 9N3 TaxID=163002 RepID=UPI00143115EC|nr:DUF4350 domain-containing protein [Thermococcus sp. 9N3]